MIKVGKFEKVSYNQFRNSIQLEFDGIFNDEEIQSMYDELQLPKRSTALSAGNDFFSPFEFTLEPGESIKIPTGIKVHIKNGWVLTCYPRSGQGFKYCLNLANNVGIIDARWYYSV